MTTEDKMKMALIREELEKRCKSLPAPDNENLHKACLHKACLHVLSGEPDEIVEGEPTQFKYFKYESQDLWCHIVYFFSPGHTLDRRRFVAGLYEPLETTLESEVLVSSAQFKDGSGAVITIARRG